MPVWQAVRNYDILEFIIWMIGFPVNRLKYRFNYHQLNHSPPEFQAHDTHLKTMVGPNASTLKTKIEP